MEKMYDSRIDLHSGTADQLSYQASLGIKTDRGYIFTKQTNLCCKNCKCSGRTLIR